MRSPENWIDEILPFPRPEYAKQTESLLTDLLWRSEGSNLVHQPDGSLFDKLSQLRQTTGVTNDADPQRLIPQRRHGGSPKLFETAPVALSTDITGLILCSEGTLPLTKAVLHSSLAPQSRGDKSDALVPFHPDMISFQTLHGLVNKQSPANLALAIETMGWLGGATAEGQVAASFIEALTSSPAGPREGITGLIEALFPVVAKHVWSSLPISFQAAPASWPEWPSLQPELSTAVMTSSLAIHRRTPFAWFWRKWQNLTAPERRWHEVLPTRRFADWALCLLRTGLAFSYLWEAEFFSRLHEVVAARQNTQAGAAAINRIRSLLIDGAVLASFEPPSVPASQKGIWPATAELLARGWVARNRFFDTLNGDTVGPSGSDLLDRLENWVNSLSSSQIATLALPLQTERRTANNQKEFVRYLLLPRSSNDDSVDQADFYFLARSNTRHLWFHPGPEWLVVIASLLCASPGGQCTLGALTNDLASLGVRTERSVLVGLLEEAGLSTDSPDADNALVIRSGF